MRIVGEEQIKNIINGDRIEGTYFIFGDEAYLKKHYCSQIFNRFEDGTGFNMQYFDSSSNMQQVYDSVCQLPFMSEKKCISVCDVDIETMDSDALNTLTESITQVGPHCVLIIWYNTKDADPSKAKTKALMEHIEKCGGTLCKIGKKSSGDICRILCNGASKRGCKMDMSTARYMIEQCSDDLTNLVTELEKLCAYVGKGGTICNNDVDKICIRTIDVKAYLLGSAIISGKTDEAMSLLSDLFYINYSEYLILGAIVSPFADIIRLRLRKDRSLGDVAADFSYGKRDFILKNALSASNKLEGNKLDICLKAINDCDTAIKYSSMPSKTALEQLVITLCHIMSGRG